MQNCNFSSTPPKMFYSVVSSIQVCLFHCIPPPQLELLEGIWLWHGHPNSEGMQFCCKQNANSLGPRNMLLYPHLLRREETKQWAQCRSNTAYMCSDSVALPHLLSSPYVCPLMDLSLTNLSSNTPGCSIAVNVLDPILSDSGTDFCPGGKGAPYFEMMGYSVILGVHCIWWSRR